MTAGIYFESDASQFPFSVMFYHDNAVTTAFSPSYAELEEICDELGLSRDAIIRVLKNRENGVHTVIFDLKRLPRHFFA